MNAIISDIGALREEFQFIVRKWLHIVRDDLAIHVSIRETMRSPERQRMLEALGKTDVKMGWHNVGLAFDFAVFKDGIYVTDGSDPLYLKCGLIAQAFDCRWPIRLASGAIDAGHIEYHPGFTLQQFLDGKKGGIVA